MALRQGSHPAVCGAKRPRYDPRVAESTALAKASRSKKVEQLTNDLLPSVVQLSKELSQDRNIMQQLEPHTAQLLLVAEIGLDKCIKLINILTNVPSNLPNRVQVVCSLMLPHFIDEGKCQVHIDIVDRFLSLAASEQMSCNGTTRYFIIKIIGNDLFAYFFMSVIS